MNIVTMAVGLVLCVTAIATLAFAGLTQFAIGGVLIFVGILTLAFVVVLCISGMDRFDTVSTQIDGDPTDSGSDQ